MWGYADSGHTRDGETSRGRLGYAFVSVGAAMSWSNSLMKILTHRSCESEFVGLSDAGNDAMFLSELQEEMGIALEGVEGAPM